MRPLSLSAIGLAVALLLSTDASAQIGKRFPSERKLVKDPVTGTMLTFLTSKPHGDSKIYPTHPQWTSDGKWLVFRSALAGSEALAVNEQTGDLVQVTEGGYTGMLNLARKSMKLYYMRKADTGLQIVETDLARVLTDSAARRMQPAGTYQRVVSNLPAELEAGGDLALDADEEWVYFQAAKHLAPGTKIEAAFGPRQMGAGPQGIARLNVRTGEVKHVVSVPFQVGHIQANLWNPGEIVFCWETGGKSPQRTWTVRADGTGLRPLYPEASYEWVTHEAVISKDEVAMAIMGHRAIPGAAAAVAGPATSVGGANPGQDDGWGVTGTRVTPQPSSWRSSTCARARCRSSARPNRAAACGTCMARATGALPSATISAAAST
jgi:oligogalacturonide lyase